MLASCLLQRITRGWLRHPHTRNGWRRPDCPRCACLQGIHALYSAPCSAGPLVLQAVLWGAPVPHIHKGEGCCISSCLLLQKPAATADLTCCSFPCGSVFISCPSCCWLCKLWCALLQCHSLSQVRVRASRALTRAHFRPQPLPSSCSPQAPLESRAAAAPTCWLPADSPLRRLVSNSNRAPLRSCWTAAPPCWASYPSTSRFTFCVAWVPIPTGRPRDRAGPLHLRAGPGRLPAAPDC